MEFAVAADDQQLHARAVFERQAHVDEGLVAFRAGFDAAFYADDRFSGKPGDEIGDVYGARVQDAAV
ncbi:MAG: hypothetical protein ACKVJG_11660 [Candidatus Latescibacterota bacterium]